MSKACSQLDGTNTLSFHATRSPSFPLWIISSALSSRRTTCRHERDRHIAELRLECVLHVGERVREVFPRKGQPTWRAVKHNVLVLDQYPQLSALREISLAKEFHDAGVPQLKHLYMGQGTAGNGGKPF
jgi:hypothetical protein